MSTITINTTAQHDAVLQRLADRYNTINGTALTGEQWLKQVVLASAFQSYVDQVRSEDSQTVREAWSNATQETKDQVKSLLGLA